MLRHFAQQARRCLRESDTLGRLGGEEFAALLPNTDLGGAQVLAERLRRTMEHSETPYGQVRIRITLSIGLYRLNPQDPNASEALRRVDRALYRAKELGRNRVETV